jgi:hypothetical protein
MIKNLKNFFNSQFITIKLTESWETILNKNIIAFFLKVSLKQVSANYLAEFSIITLRLF